MLQSLVIIILAFLLAFFAGGTDRREEPPAGSAAQYRQAPADPSLHGPADDGSADEGLSTDGHRDDAADEEQEKAVITAGPALLYPFPGAAEPIGHLGKGESVQVLSREGSWWHVRDEKGRQGYMRSFLLAPHEEAPWRPMVLGYYLPGSAAGSEDSLRSFSHQLTAVSPWMWQVEPDGSLRTDFSLAPTAAALAYAGRHGLETHALIHNLQGDTFDPGLAARILTNTGAQERLIGELKSRLREWGLTGVHIDFENVPPEYRDDLTAFVARISGALRAEGIQVSMAVPARTADSPWHLAYDYKSLAPHLDFMVVMTYDQHWRAGPPGPIASIQWVSAVVDYLTEDQGIPPHQIVLGIAGYGYDWPATGTGQWARAVTYRQAMNTLAAARQRDGTVQLRWDDSAQMPFFTYEGRIVYFENADSLSHKLQLVRERRLGGVALWRLGQEDPKLWSLFPQLWPERNS